MPTALAAIRNRGLTPSKGLAPVELFKPLSCQPAGAEASRSSAASPSNKEEPAAVI